jgi:hypothetical protein
MNNKSRFLALVLICLTVSAMMIPHAAVAQTDSMSVEEFRENFTAYVIWLDSSSSSHKLTMQIQAMSDDEFQVIYDSFADPDGFIASTERLMAPRLRAEIPYARAFHMPLASQAAVALPSPDYLSNPSDNRWLTFFPSIFTVPLIPLNTDWATEGCAEHVEGDLTLAAEAAEAAAIAVDIACNVDPTKLSCAGAAFLHEVSLAANSLVNKCSYISGAADSAENHVTYEISKIISSQVSTHDADIKTILEANNQELLDLLSQNQTQLLRIEIEKELSMASDNKRLSYFYLPQAQGGILELVRQTVLDTINYSKAAGMSVGNAQPWFGKADASLANGNYKAAYDLYKKAYLEAVK